MSSEVTAIHDLEQRLRTIVPVLDITQQRVAAELTRLLSYGAPVTPERVADALHVSSTVVTSALGGLRSVVLDDHGRAVSCCGLTVRETAHRLEVDGRMAYTWCAWDALVLPELLGRPVRATSRCPASGDAIAVEVRVDGTHNADPETTVMSFVMPDVDWGSDIAASFCRHVHFFASAELCTHWLEHHRQAFLLPLEAGCRFARMATRAGFPDLALPLPGPPGETAQRA